MELERTINRLIWMTPTELSQCLDAPSTPMFDRFVAKIIMLGEEAGDERRLEFVLQRIIGKVQDRIEVKTPTPFVIKRSSGEEVVLGAALSSEEKT